MTSARPAYGTVVVGASVAGVRVVDALRQAGYTGSVLLLGAEDHLPCDRPPLTKEFLAGKWDEARIRLRPETWFLEHSIDLRLGVEATGIDTVARRVSLADGTAVGYGQCVIATGATPRRGPWTSRRTHVVRTLADASALRSALEPDVDVVVIGGGYIGAEVAAAAHGRGCRVTVVDVVPNPYERSLGRELGETLCTVHARHGVTAHFGVGVRAVRDVPDRAVVVLDDGTELTAHVAVVGIGVVPNTAWLDGSAVEVDDGVVCDEFGRTSAESVYAIGDVARWAGRRHEHWTSAVEQAAAVGRTLAAPGSPAASASDGYVWSDQYDWKVQLAGETGPHLRPEVVSSATGEVPRLAALYRDAAGVLVGVAALNWPKAFLTCRRTVGYVSAEQQVAALRTLAVPAGV